MTFLTELSRLSDAATQGEWNLVSDAQGPCMVMHPSRSGVAIASLTEVFNPAKGFHDPTVDVAKPCAEAYGGDTYRPERVANARLIALLANRRREILALVEAVDAAYVDSSRTRALDRIFSARANLDRAQEGE